MEKELYKILVIVGPTASGKSELAVKLAKKFNGEVISADSRQVYKGLDIGTGKVPKDKIPNSKFPPTKSRVLDRVGTISKQTKNTKYNPPTGGQNTKYYYKGIRHHLIDVASPKKTFTVIQYKKLAKKAIKDILQRGKLPIICGGTGFYIDAVIYDYNLANCPPNKKLRKKLEIETIESLYEKLKLLDPKRAKTIDKNNKRRLVRALEITITTGKKVPLSPKKESKYDVLKIGISVPVEELKKRIKKRLAEWFKIGLIKEIETLKENGLSWKKIEEFGLEYRAIAKYLKKEMSKEESIKKSESEIYKYAKRQMTWFNKDKEIHWIKNYEEAKRLIKI